MVFDSLDQRLRTPVATGHNGRRRRFWNNEYRWHAGRDPNLRQVL